MTTRNRHTQLIHICLPVFRYMGICCFCIFFLFVFSSSPLLRTATAPNDRHIAYLTQTQHPHLRVFILELRNALKRHALVFILLRNASVFTHLTFTCLKPPASPSHRLQHGRHMPGKRSFGPLLPTTGSLPPQASLFRAFFFSSVRNRSVKTRTSALTFINLSFSTLCALRALSNFIRKTAPDRAGTMRRQAREGDVNANENDAD